MPHVTAYQECCLNSLAWNVLDLSSESGQLERASCKKGSLDRDDCWECWGLQICWDVGAHLCLKYGATSLSHEDWKHQGSDIDDKYFFNFCASAERFLSCYLRLDSRFYMRMPRLIRHLLASQHRHVYLSVPRMPCEVHMFTGFFWPAMRSIPATLSFEFKHCFIKTRL